MLINIRLTISLLLIIMFSLMACTSTPFIRHRSPGISGTLYSNNLPAKNIQLYLSISDGDKHCSQYIVKTETNERGYFSISSVKEKMSYTPLFTHYFDEWILCVDRNGTRQAVYSNNRYGQGSVMTSVSLICDLKNIGRKQPPCNTPLPE